MTTAAPPAFKLMVDHLAEAARDLFAAYDVPVKPCENASVEGFDEGEVWGMAVIGYSGAGVRGALIMTAAERAIFTWMAAAGVPDGDVADTLAEFSNMLLGRLKERLLPLGISIIATTPTAATGSRFRFSEAPGPSTSSAFEGPGWSMRVRLDANFDPDFQQLEGRALAWHARAGEAIDFDAPETSEK